MQNLKRLGAVLAIAFLGVSAVACSSNDNSTSKLKVIEPSPPARESVTVPTVVAATGGRGQPFIAAATGDLAAAGYEQSEYFISGKATSFQSTQAITVDGNWTVSPATTADYKTRAIVRRPSDPANFNGNVIVEWLNVSGGLDAGPDWTYTHVELMREGYAWVGLSAQVVGIDGGPSMGLVAGYTLKAADPGRYGSLVHPGDQYSYDMYTQTGAAAWFANDVLLGGLQPERVIAIGESQSAFRLTTYVNAIAPNTDVWDGYLIHSRGTSGAALNVDVKMPADQRVRTDLKVPILQFQAETDMLGRGLNFVGARQPDSDMVRTWEVAGTAHADAYNLGIGDTDNGDGAGDAALFQAMLTPPSSLYGGLLSCTTPINSGPHTYVLRAALNSLDNWIRTGQAPESRPLLDIENNAFVLDAKGNATGGIRSPHVDVPVATLSGLGQTGSAFCGLFGTTVTPPPAAFTTWALPNGRESFNNAWITALDDAVVKGNVLEVDAVKLRIVVKNATMPS
ncbi:MAG: alpha/beta hydrolase domain-containing protein [Acidimicrobiales bacterium]